MSDFYCETLDSGEPPCAGLVALRARLAEVISERDDLRTMLLNERNERATDSEVNPRHICGAQGYNPMIDPPCPACTPDSATPRETASHE